MRPKRILRPRGWALLAAVAVAAGLPLVGGTPGGAGVLPDSLTVNKVVTGAVPPGTTFTVSVECVGADSTGATAPSSSSTTSTSTRVHSQVTATPTVITFNAQGDPTPAGSNFVNPTAPSTCTVTETANGGASSVTYACAVTASPTPLAAAPVDPVSCVTGQSAEYTVAGDGAAATITVTNVFPAAAIVAAPAFTG